MLNVNNSRTMAILVATGIATTILVYGTWWWSAGAETAFGTTARANVRPNDAPGVTAGERDSIDLSDSQLTAVKVEAIEQREFPLEKEAVGSIDFNEEMSVQVFTPYQGRIISLFASV